MQIGYSNTAYKHDLKGFYFFQDTASQFIVNNTGEGLPAQVNGFTDWLNDPRPTDTIDVEEDFGVPFALVNPVFNPRLDPSTFQLDTDTADLGFEGFANGIPFLISAHYEYEDFRVGLGWSYEQQWIKQLKPTSFTNQIRIYEPNFKTTRLTKFFGLFGYRFYQYWDYDFVGEIQVGRAGYGPAFGDALSRGLFLNVGISIENNWSQYFRVIVKPSYDFKKYTINIPGGGSVTHKQGAFLIQGGISINIPEIPRSPYKSDHVQLKHVITDPNTGRLTEVRGQSIFKKQNPKVGQNHRKLFRYKFRNRKKLNPY